MRCKRPTANAGKVCAECLGVKRTTKAAPESDHREPLKYHGPRI